MKLDSLNSTTTMSSISSDSSLDHEDVIQNALKFDPRNEDLKMEFGRHLTYTDMDSFTQG